jgi:hypothetical protein
MARVYGSGMGRHGMPLEDTPGHIPPNTPRVPTHSGDYRPILYRVAPEMDENAVIEWAEILAADAPRLNGRQTARLRRLFNARVDTPEMRGQSLPVGESVAARATREVSRIEPDTR